MGIIEGLKQAVDYAEGDKTQAREERITVPDGAEIIAICTYVDWSIVQVADKLFYCNGDGEQEACEVFRIKAGFYEDKETADLEEIATDANILFDVCGELDDCSAFVFWVLV